eukprot:15560512-Heterocapsa_arctica.AAC.1
MAFWSGDAWGRWDPHYHGHPYPPRCPPGWCPWAWCCGWACPPGHPNLQLPPIPYLPPWPL